MSAPIFFSIHADSDLLEICEQWHSGQWSAMYSILSTGEIANADYLRSLVSELRGINRHDELIPEE